MAAQTHADGPELVFGLIGAVGTDLDVVAERLSDAMTAHAYTSVLVRISQLIDAIDPKRPLGDPRLDRYINNHMDGGNRLRKRFKSGDAAALLSLGAIRRQRAKLSGSPTRPAKRHAYILRSFKHPKEVEAMRSVYASRLHVVAAYSPRDTRVKHLASQIAATYQSSVSSDFLEKAQQLATRDEAEEDKDYGQRVRDAFPLADVFVETTDPQTLDESLSRFVEGIFGYPFHTPTREESGMFYARAAALRSADLSRQVGAAICTPEGDVMSVGCNEVPRADGGLYWEDGVPDARDFRIGEDKNQTLKRLATGEVLERLRKARWLAPGRSAAKLSQFEKLIDGTRIDSLIEFGRAVHAEMAALTDAARRGVAVHGCDLYTTTFPCHNCAKHIVAAGIKRVIYVEPYPKSLADELHNDAIAVDPSGTPANLVSFKPFVGVAPTAFMGFFAKQQRKDKLGKAMRFEASNSSPALVDPGSDVHRTREGQAEGRKRRAEEGHLERGDAWLTPTSTG